LADTTLMTVLPGADLVADLARRLGDADPDSRRAALETLAGMEPPHRAEHLWRFTDPAALLPEAWDAAAADAPAPPALSVDGDAFAGTVVLASGGPPAVVLDDAARAAGVTVTPLAAAAPAARAAAGAADDPGFFPRLNAAAWNAGALVRIPANVRLERPLRVIVAASALALPRLLVEVGAGAALTLLEDHRGDAGRVLGASLLAVGAGADVRHLLLQRWGDGVTGYLHRRAVLDRDAVLRTAFAALGGRRAKLEIGARLAAPGGRSEMIGVALADGDDRHLDLHTRHRHDAPLTTSDIDFRAVVAGTARSTYTGLIRIEEAARGCEAFQENRNLLLSEKARADSIPELEILNEDVACSHGATMAPVDRDQCFYLESRGLDPDAAVRLVVSGFLEPTLARLPAEVRPGIDRLVNARLASWLEVGS